MVRRYLRFSLVLALLLAGCTSTQGIPALNPTAGPENAVAQITYRDGTTEYITQQTLEQFQRLFSGPGGQPAPPAPVLDELLTRQLLLRQARNQDVVADPQEVAQFVESVLTNPQACASQLQQPPPGPGQDNSAYLDECAKAFGFADGMAFRNFLAEQLTINAIVQREAEKDQIKVAHILWMKKETPEQSDADYVAALEVYEQLCGTHGPVTEPAPLRCENADQFTELAKQVSEEPGANERGGELPPFNEQGLTDQQQSFDPTFVSQSWALKPTFLEQGVAITRPFETDFGWHIVKVLELVSSEAAGQSYRQAVLQRAKEASLADLQQPDQGPVPLIGVVEILQPLPSPPAVPTIEPIVPDETATPDAADVVPAQGTPEPAATAEATDDAAPDATAAPGATTTP